MPGDLHQTLVGSLPQNGASLPPEGLSPSLSKMVFVGGGSCGTTLLVRWKAMEIKHTQKKNYQQAHWVDLPKHLPHLETAHVAILSK